MNPSTPTPFEMSSSSIDQILYFCIAKSGRILQSHCSGRILQSHCSGDHESLKPIAERCIGCAPPFHSRYFHTVGERTFGFLIEDGTTYFVVVQSSIGSSGALRLLQRIRDGFKKCAKSGVQDELLPILRGLIQSLESISRPSDVTEEAPSPTKVPLLRSSTSSRMDRKKDRAGDVGGERALRIDVQPETGAGAGAGVIQRSLSSKGRGPQGRRLWCRHVKLVIAVDILLCLVLFGVWLGVCKGFQCVS